MPGIILSRQMLVGASAPARRLVVSAINLGQVFKMSLRGVPLGGATKQSSWIAPARCGGPRDDPAF
jgi:hypothetical protein